MAQNIAVRIRAELEGNILSGAWPLGTHFPCDHNFRRDTVAPA